MYSVHPNYDTVLKILSSTSTNSPKTSSLPLADFWRPEQIEQFESKEAMKKLCNKINIEIENFDPKEADYCFEYPTPAYENRESGKTLRHSKPSMTDLMIFLNDKKGTRITIEAKYTEYGKKGKEKEYSPLLKKWYEKESSHKKEILECWIDYIKKDKRGCGHISSADILLKEYPELPYQFLHRTASACFNCERPILVYQLFYDQENAREMGAFEKHLQEWAKMLKLDENKLPFFIVETKVGLDSPAFVKLIKESSDLFIYMRNEEQYTFGDITVRDGYTLKEL